MWRRRAEPVSARAWRGRSLHTRHRSAPRPGRSTKRSQDRRQSPARCSRSNRRWPTALLWPGAGCRRGSSPAESARLGPESGPVAAPPPAAYCPARPAAVWPSGHRSSAGRRGSGCGSWLPPMPACGPASHRAVRANRAPPPFRWRWGRAGSVRRRDARRQSIAPAGSSASRHASARPPRSCWRESAWPGCCNTPRRSHTRAAACTCCRWKRAPPPATGFAETWPPSGPRCVAGFPGRCGSGPIPSIDTAAARRSRPVCRPAPPPGPCSVASASSRRLPRPRQNRCGQLHRS